MRLSSGVVRHRNLPFDIIDQVMKSRRDIMTWGIIVSILAVRCGGSIEQPGAAPGVLLAADVDAGRRIYDNNGCANCHGPDGSGRGPNAPYMNPPPRDYRDPESYKAGITVDAVAESIAIGFSEDGAAMPAFAHLNAEQLRQLATLVVSLQRPESKFIRVEDAWVAETPSGTNVTAAYMTLVHDAPESDALVEVEVKGARVRVHETRDQDGLTSMQPLERVELGPVAIVELAPGGLHIMLSGLRSPLIDGDMVEMVLYFESRTARRLNVPVRRRRAES